MDRTDVGASVKRAFPVPAPIPALIVPEDGLKRLVYAARNTVFEASDIGAHSTVPKADIAALDRTSEPFADMVSIDDIVHAKCEVLGSVEHVRAWLDAGCVTLPPVHHIRAVVESFT